MTQLLAYTTADFLENEMEPWVIEPFDSSDKDITVYAGDIRLLVDYDDVDHVEAEFVARFIVAMQDCYEAWKSKNEPW